MWHDSILVSKLRSLHPTQGDSILDGLDEVPAAWRGDALTRLDDWLPVGMPIVLTCRIREYDDLIQDRHRGVGLTMAVQLEPLDDDQLDKAFTEIAARGDESWSELIGQWQTGQRHAVREALCSPLLLNLAVASGLNATQLRTAGRAGPEAVEALVRDHYLTTVLGSDPPLRSWARWIARYLLGRQIGPFGAKSADETVFQLSEATPDVVPWRYAAMVVYGLTTLVMIAMWAVIRLPGDPLPTGALIGFPLAVAALFATPRLRRAAPTRVQFRVPEWRIIVAVTVRAVAVGLGVTAVGYLLLLVSAWPPGSSYWWELLRDWREILPLLFSLLGVPATLVCWLLLLLGPRPVRVSGALEGPWRQARQSVWGLGLLSSLATGIAFSAGASASTLIAPSQPPSLEDLLYTMVLGSVVGLQLGIIVALSNGGWFLVFQRLARRRLYRDQGLDQRPLSVLRRGTLSRDSTLPLFRTVGSGVRFIHNDVRDRLGATHGESR